MPETRGKKISALDQRLTALEEQVDALRGLVTPALDAAKKQPPLTCTNCGVIVERILKDIWRREALGDPERATLQPLVDKVRTWLRSASLDRTRADEALSRIQRIQSLRNRGVHDSLPLTPDNAFEAIRHLDHVVEWYVQDYLRQEMPRASTMPFSGRFASTQPPPARRPRAIVVAGVASAVLLATLAVLVARAALRPRVDRIVLVDGGAEGWSLVVSGQHLGRLDASALSEWRRRLAGAGLTPRVDAQFTAAPDGGSASLGVDDPGAFAGASLPSPSGGADMANVTIRARVRLVFLAYRKEDYAVGEKFARYLARELRAATELARDGIEFDEEPYVQFRSESDFEQGKRGLTRGDAKQFDLFYTSAFIAAMLERLLGDEAARDRQIVRWLACNVGPDDTTTYHSVLITRADGRLARSLKPGEMLTPQRLDGVLAALSGDEKLEWYWGPHASTSGFAVPCLTWGRYYGNPRVDSIHTSMHHDTATAVLGGAARKNASLRLGAINAEVANHLTTHPPEPLDASRTIWKSDAIPHGGIFLRVEIPKAKRTAYEKIFDAMVAATASGSRSIEWPAAGEIRKLAGCPLANLAELTRKLRDAPEAALCVPTLTPVGK